MEADGETSQEQASEQDEIESEQVPTRHELQDPPPHPRNFTAGDGGSPTAQRQQLTRKFSWEQQSPGKRASGATTFQEMDLPNQQSQSFIGKLVRVWHSLGIKEALPEISKRDKFAQFTLHPNVKDIFEDFNVFGQTPHPLGCEDNCDMCRNVSGGEACTKHLSDRSLDVSPYWQPGTGLNGQPETQRRSSYFAVSQKPSEVLEQRRSRSFSGGNGPTEQTESYLPPFTFQSAYKPPPPTRKLVNSFLPSMEHGTQTKPEIHRRPLNNAAPYRAYRERVYEFKPETDIPFRPVNWGSKDNRGSSNGGPSHQAPGTELIAVKKHRENTLLRLSGLDQPKPSLKRKDRVKKTRGSQRSRLPRQPERKSSKPPRRRPHSRLGPEVPLRTGSRRWLGGQRISRDSGRSPRDTSNSLGDGDGGNEPVDRRDE
ncbi:Uu.00g094390.m01.CDS01 [Anthostomella pinea]|uniref:Uu.00g094390.m01.CDS01 n=1 Tax=Anthostomella pinea TaxID=933095 RepID=A0AAI8YKS8_9PEZI|nr:Uu.00g094390.m01.CDS01 [Anthostomella pinea]